MPKVFPAEMAILSVLSPVAQPSIITEIELQRGQLYWWGMKAEAKIVLISTYELGRQPFGLASPAAWLRKRGYRVVCIDLARQAWDESAVREAYLIAIYLPMHTATRLAAQLLPTLRAENPRAHICCYGLYAPMNAEYLRSLGVRTILGGEFEKGLVHLADRLAHLNGNGGGISEATSIDNMS